MFKKRGDSWRGESAIQGKEKGVADSVIGARGHSGLVSLKGHDLREADGCKTA